MTEFATASCEILQTQGTGSDRKDAKAAIHGMLDPRHPWHGTLSSSDPVPCDLS